MQRTWKKMLMASSMTVALSAALVAPASAAAGSSPEDLSSYLQNWLQNNGYKVVVQTGEVQWPSTQTEEVSKPTKPATTTTTSPQATKPQTAPTKPVAPPSTGTNSNANASGNSSSSGNTQDKSQFAAKVVELVNVERSKAGLSPLTVHTNLTKVAVEKAKDMSVNNYFSHTSPTYGSPFDMMKQFGVTYSYAGENIAMGQKTPEEVMKGWMNSPGHKANILNKNFTMIGVGYYNGYWVQEFIGK